MVDWLSNQAKKQVFNKIKGSTRIIYFFYHNIMQTYCARQTRARYASHTFHLVRNKRDFNGLSATRGPKIHLVSVSLLLCFTDWFTCVLSFL